MFGNKLIWISKNFLYWLADRPIWGAANAEISPHLPQPICFWVWGHHLSENVRNSETMIGIKPGTYDASNQASCLADVDARIISNINTRERRLSSSSRKKLLCVKSQIVQGNEKTVPNVNLNWKWILEA